MDHRILITFDDGFSSQFDIARPILRKLGLTATFFICGAFIDHDSLKDIFMEWKEVKQLSKEGFEVGSHLYHHFAMIDEKVNHYANIKELEKKFKTHKIPKPVTLSYPGYHVDNKAIKVVRDAGYRFARAGCEKTAEFDEFQKGGFGSHYNYLYDNPLNINCAGIFGKDFGFGEFKKSLIDVKPEEISVYCFHSFNGRGVPGAPETDISKDTFEKCMNYIAEGPYQTIKMCEIES